MPTLEASIAQSPPPETVAPSDCSLVGSRATSAPPENRVAPRLRTGILAAWERVPLVAVAVSSAVAILLVALGSWAAAAVLAAAALGAVAWPRVRGSASVDAVFATRLFLLALAMRALAGAAIWVGSLWLGSSPYWFPDAWAFDQMSRQLALHFQGLPANIPTTDSYLVNLYTRSVGVLYMAVGYQPLLPISINWLLGSLAPVLVYAAALPLAGTASSRSAAIVTAFVPSVFLWSLFNLREAVLVLLVALNVWAVPRVVRQADWVAVLIGAAGLVLLARLRFYIGIPALWCAILVLVVTTRKRDWRIHLVPSIALAALLVVVPIPAEGGVAAAHWLATSGTDEEFLPSSAVLHAATLPGLSAPRGEGEGLRGGAAAPTGERAGGEGEGLRGGAAASLIDGIRDRMAGVMATVNGAITLGSSVRVDMARWYAGSGDRTLFVTPDQAVACREVTCLLAYLPSSAAYVLFAPFPWSMTTLKDLSVLPELPVWYAAVTLSVAGVCARLREWRGWLYPAALAVGITLVLAVFEANVGVIVRHRAMLLPPLAVLAAQGAQVVVSRARAAGQGARSRVHA